MQITRLTVIAFIFFAAGTAYAAAEFLLTIPEMKSKESENQYEYCVMRARYGTYLSLDEFNMCREYAFLYGKTYKTKTQ